MRLDHLLSKEHHEKHSNWWSDSREGFSSVVDEGRVHNNIRFFLSGTFGLGGGGSRIAGTLLGPEATP